LRAAATAHRWLPAVTGTSEILSVQQTDEHNLVVTFAYRQLFVNYVARTKRKMLERGILSIAKESARGERIVTVGVMRDFTICASLKCPFIIITLEASVTYYRKSRKISRKMKASMIFSRRPANSNATEQQ